MEFNDEKLITMFSENDEDAKNILYDKYSYIISIILAKYKRTIYALGIDISEVKQEAMLAFTDALIKYSSDKSTSLPTFISLVVERKIQNCIRKAETTKNKVNTEAYSLEAEYEVFKRPLEEILGDSSLDPLHKMENEERLEELTKKINDDLSPFEKDVYKLVINGFGYQDIAKILNKEPKQIDNTIQRIRNKIKDLL
ncbi:sigma-70 family RNA polymerase sigma factor [bacterium]|nr:sigma-70 family RNA polymerase sigma factor [bacterium]MDY3757386.1 sigma-70 family RNA polymerase sigma factor [Bacilli bacterium]